MAIRNYVINALAARKNGNMGAKNNDGNKLEPHDGELSEDSACSSSSSAKKNEYVKSLSKCKYQISIHNELKKTYEDDDYYSGLKQFLGMQPLEKLPAENDIERIETQCLEELDGTKKCYSKQPNIGLIQNGVIDFHDFVAAFYLNNANIRCKEGFADLAIANFAKYNNPTKFEIMRNIFNNDVDPCAAYELQEKCDPMPIGLEDLHYKIVQMAPEIATSFEIHHL